MKIFKNIIIYPLQFIIFLIIFFSFKIIPNHLASDLGGKIFKIFGPLTKSNDTLKKNLIKIFNENNHDNISLIQKKCWENLGRTMAELSHLKKIINEKNDITIEGFRNLKDVLNNKEQAIFIGIHQSNWEILGPIMTNYGIKINFIYRHINNSFIDKFILKVRKNANLSSNTILSPKGKKSALDIIKSINRGFSIALLVDQKDSSGLDIPLLGHISKTQTGFLKLSKKFKLKIYPIENKRVNKNQFKVIFHEPLNLFDNDEVDEIKAMTKIHNIIGEWIKKEPNNWLWQHKRWG